MNTRLNGGILLATDGSAGAEPAEVLATAIAAAMNCRLVILVSSRGLPNDELRRLAHAGQTEHNIAEARHALIEQILNRASERAKSAGVADVLPLSYPGDPADVIVSTAKEQQVQMIVMGKRSIGAVSRLLLGSVSRTVADHAHCAVTVVPAPE